MRLALCVGLNYAGTDRPLSGASVDAAHMRQLCLDCGFDEDKVLVLDDTNGTKKTLYKAFDRIAALPAGSSAVFSYSGHGKQQKDKSGDEIDGKDEVICPVKNKNGKRSLDSLTDDELRANLIDRVPAGVRLTCFFDCCNSGSVCDLRYCVKTDHQQKDKHYAQTVGDVVCFSACRDAQSSLDGPSGGLFTNNLLWAIKDESAKGEFTYGQLFGNLAYRFSDGVYNPYLSFGNKNTDLNTVFSL